MRKWLFMLCFSGIFLGSKLSAQYAIGEAQFTYNDPTRDNRPVSFALYYPESSHEKGEESFPLIVFGHGFLMTWEAYENLWTHWVPQGYIMAFPTTEEGFAPDHSEFAGDIAFLVDTLLALNDDDGFLLFDRFNQKAAVMGHSMGGGAAVLAAALTDNVHALLGLASAETNPSAINQAAEIDIPTLIFGASADDVTPEADHQIPIYENIEAPTKTFISIIGGGHCYFAEFNFFCNLGEAGSSQNITITREQQQQITVNFATLWLDYFLYENCEAWEVLQDSLQSSERISHWQSSWIQKPVVTQEDSLLLASPAFQYQWFKDHVALEGATSQIYYPNQAGMYKVEVQFHNACYYQSEPFYYREPLGVDISIHPPASGDVVLSPNSPWFEGDTLLITAYPAEGFAFQHWKINDSIFVEYPIYELLLDGDISLNAFFSPINTSVTAVEKKPTIYPNPAFDKITISFSRDIDYEKLMLLASDGTIVASHQVTTNPKLILPVQHLSPGAYYLILSGNGNRYTTKVVIHE